LEGEELKEEEKKEEPSLFEVFEPVEITE